MREIENVSAELGVDAVQLEVTAHRMRSCRALQPKEEGRAPNTKGIPIGLPLCVSAFRILQGMEESPVHCGMDIILLRP